VILRSIQLQPFAGVTNERFRFEPGMNVVLGPNEAGKSTLVRALLAVLFESTQFKKPHWTKELQQYVPRGGGDTFRVELECDVGSKTYRIVKSWGPDSRSELVLPSGDSVTDPSDVDAQLGELLTLKPGTWRNILIANQAALPGTLTAVTPEADETADLAQLLRRAVLNTDGVSIEALRHSIDHRLDRLTSRWDLDLDRPEKDRGIDHPWKNNVGELLDAWYAYEQLKADRVSIEQYERDMDAATTEVTRLSKEVAELQSMHDKWAPIVKAVDERRTLTLELDQAEKHEEQLRNVQKSWPRQAERAKQLAESVPKLEEQIRQIDNELAEAQAYQKSAEKRATLTKALESQKTLRSLQAERDGLPAVTDADIDQLDTLEQRVAELRSGIESGKLKLRFQAHSALQLDVQTGLDDPQAATLQDGQSREWDAEGRIVLTTPDWTIGVESGDGGFQAMKENYDTAVSQFKQLLAKLKTDDPQNARDQHAAFRNAGQAVATQQTHLDAILNGTTIEALTEAVGQDLPQPRRTIEQIITDREAHKTKQTQENQEHTDLTQQLAEWSEAYESEDALLDVLLQARGISKELATKLQKLPQLPDEIEDHESFVTSFHEQNDQLTELRQDLLPQAQQERVRLEQNTPEMTVQTIDEQLADAGDTLDRKRRELQGWQRISEIFDQLRSDLDSGTLDPWNNSLRTWTSNLTANRYSDLDIESGQAMRSGAFELPLPLLSQGTQSCLGVALRLSMAAHFLQDLSGFVILDDPMVDLDPERQALLAATLKQFADNQQTIIFTCHPAHAELLSETPVTLKRLP